MVRLSRQALRRCETLQSATLHDFAFRFFLETQGSVHPGRGVEFDRHSALVRGKGGSRQGSELVHSAPPHW